MMEAVSTSEMSVNFQQTTWHNTPEDSHLLNDDVQELILDETLRVFHGTTKEELPHLRSYRLGELIYIYIYADQRSGQGTIQAMDGQKLREEPY
jgi:hypothetical protein